MYTSRLLFLFFIISTNVILSLQMSLSNSSHAVTQEKVKISLYYEALCPYCEEFIKEELYPGYQILGDVVTLDLVPYGNAERYNVRGKWIFECQHGVTECYGNKIQACVLAKNTQKKSMDFIVCLTTNRNSNYEKKAEECAIQTSLSWKDINSCANGDEGTELLVKYGEKTDSLVPSLEYVPSIWFNDVFDQHAEDGAWEDLVKTACGKFKVKPAVCSK